MTRLLMCFIFVGFGLMLFWFNLISVTKCFIFLHCYVHCICATM